KCLSPVDPAPQHEERSVSHMAVDIPANLASLNVYNAMRSPDLGKTVEVGMRALTTVSDTTSIDRAPTVKKGNEEMRSVGLGQMSLATLFGTEEMYYGDEDSLDFTNIYFMTINYYSLLASTRMAQERNSTFDGFEESAYADGSYFDQYVQGAGIRPQREKTRAIFEKFGQRIPTVQDWEALKTEV